MSNSHDEDKLLELVKSGAITEEEYEILKNKRDKSSTLNNDSEKSENQDIPSDTEIPKRQHDTKSNDQTIDKSNNKKKLPEIFYSKKLKTTIIIIIVIITFGSFIVGKSISDNEKISEVEDAISEIGTVKIILEIKVETAEDKYNKLPESLRKRVENRGVLVSARQQLDKLKCEKAISLINDIGKVTLARKVNIETAESFYNELDEDLKKEVTNHNVLVESKKKYDELKKKDDKKKAKIAKKIEKKKRKIAARTIDGKYYIVKKAYATTEYYGANIKGTLRNDSGTNLSYAQVEFVIYDESGETIIGSAIDNISNWPAGAKWKYEAYVSIYGEKFQYSSRPTVTSYD